MSSTVFSFPTPTLFGAGCISELPARLGRLRISRPLVVTDAGLLPTPSFQRLQSVLGSESFAQKLKDKLNSHSPHAREVTAVRRAARQSDPRKLLARAAAHYGVPVSKLLQERKHGSEARNVAIWLLRQCGDLTLREIGLLFGGMDYAAVSQRIRRVEVRLRREKHLAKTCQILNV